MREPRSRETLDRVSQMAESYRPFELLKDEAFKKLERVENSLTKLLFRTSTEIDPLKIEYDRGFRQGVIYALEGLPNEIAAEWQRLLKQESDTE